MLDEGMMSLGEELLQHHHNNVHQPTPPTATHLGLHVSHSQRVISEHQLPSTYLPLHHHHTASSQASLPQLSSINPVTLTPATSNSSIQNTGSTNNLVQMIGGLPSPASLLPQPYSSAAGVEGPGVGLGLGGGLPPLYPSIPSSNLSSERVLVVANRLPVTCSKKADGSWQLQSSSGGLVSALKVIPSSHLVGV